MDVNIVKDPQEGGKLAFDIIKKAKKENDSLVFGLATGSTPEPMYEEIRNSDLDFTNDISINLDEYVGLESNHPQSYNYFMNKHLFSDKPFKKNYLPDGTGDPEEVTKEYDQIIEENPIDIQILGIGGNGHIGFNEPGTSFDVTTRKVELAPETIEANKRFFASEKDVPRYAYSMGIKSIMQSEKIILMAFGEAKAKAVNEAINGPVTEDLPASVLQNHDNVTVIVDEDAAKYLNK